jgi:uncharacterized protein with PQ loop repeat
MKFEIMDKDVSLTMNVFLIIANIINVVYNIPQMVKTYKCKSTKELSSWFLFLRIVGNSIWVGYAIEVDSMMMLINNIITVIASIFIGYYKVLEIHKERMEKKQDCLEYKDTLHDTLDDDDDDNDNENKNKNYNKINYNHYQKNNNNYQQINDNYNYNDDNYNDDNYNDDKLYEV